MSFSSDEQDDKLIRVQMTRAIEKFMLVPERLEEELAPIIKKMLRLSQSPVVIKIKTGGMSRLSLTDLRLEIKAFLRYMEEIPRKHLIRVDSDLDMLNDLELSKEEVAQYYVSAINRVKKQLIQEVKDKYSAAIRVILEYSGNSRKGESPGDYQEDWTAPRARHTGPIPLSLLPTPLLEQLPFGKSRETLDELSLEEIQTVAHSLAVCVSQGGDKNS